MCVVCSLAVCLNINNSAVYDKQINVQTDGLLFAQCVPNLKSEHKNYCLYFTLISLLYTDGNALQDA